MPIACSRANPRGVPMQMPRWVIRTLGCWWAARERGSDGTGAWASPCCATWWRSSPCWRGRLSIALDYHSLWGEGAGSVWLSAVCTWPNLHALQDIFAGSNHQYIIELQSAQYLVYLCNHLVPAGSPLRALRLFTLEMGSWLRIKNRQRHLQPASSTTLLRCVLRWHLSLLDLHSAACGHARWCSRPTACAAPRRYPGGARAPTL